MESELEHLVSQHPLQSFETTPIVPDEDATVVTGTERADAVDKIQLLAYRWVDIFFYRHPIARLSKLAVSSRQQSMCVYMYVCTQVGCIQPSGKVRLESKYDSLLSVLQYQFSLWENRIC